jgi:hypothetical protein
MRTNFGQRIYKFFLIKLSHHDSNFGGTVIIIREQS